MMGNHFDTKIDMSNILFKGWSTTSTIDVVLASFLTFLFTFLFEGLKVAKQHIIAKRKAHPIESIFNDYSTFGSETTEPQAELLSSLRTISSLKHIRNQKAKLFILEFLIYVLSFAAAYFIMLLVMTYNVWFLVAVLTGSGMGFWVWNSLGQRFVPSTSSSKELAPSRGRDNQALDAGGDAAVMTFPSHSDSAELLDHRQRRYYTFVPTKE